MSQKNLSTTDHSSHLRSEHPLAQKLVRKADWALEDEDYEEATKLFEQALSYDPDFDYAKFGLAKTHTENGAPKEALPILNSLRKQYPDDSEMVNEYGLALLEDQQYKEAQKIFESLLKQKPIYPSAHANLGYLWEQTHQPDKAIEAYKEYIKVADDEEQLEEVRATIQTIERKQRRKERQKARKQTKQT